MVSPKLLLSTIESSLLGPTSPSPSQRIELKHAIRHSLPSLQSLLSYPPPKQSDRAQVQSREVRLPDSSPISLDEQDVQIVILSPDADPPVVRIMDCKYLMERFGLKEIKHIYREVNTCTAVLANEGSKKGLHVLLYAPTYLVKHLNDDANGVVFPRTMFNSF